MAATLPAMPGPTAVDYRQKSYQELKSRVHSELLNRVRPDEHSRIDLGDRLGHAADLGERRVVDALRGRPFAPDRGDEARGSVSHSGGTHVTNAWVER